MKRILILGGYGETGRLLAHHLLERTRAELVLAGRNLGTAESLANELRAKHGRDRVSAARADAASPDDMQRALRYVDFLLVAAPTGQHAETVARAALTAGVDYLDVQLDANKLATLQALATEIEAAGCCFITEAGFHPGLPSALVRYAAARLDSLEQATVGCYLNMGQSLPYTEAVDELMEVFRDYQGQVLAEGKWTRRGSYDIRKIDFGGEIGIRRGFSMFFEELRSLPQMIPTLRDMGFYMSETHWIVDYLLTPLVLLGLKLAPRRGVRPLGRMLWWGMGRFSRPPYLVSLKIEATGRPDGASGRLELSLSHPDGYELTAIPVVACLLQVLDGSARRPGLWMMGHLVDPSRLLVDMEEMGVTVCETVV